MIPVPWPCVQLIYNFDANPDHFKFWFGSNFRIILMRIRIFKFKMLRILIRFLILQYVREKTIFLIIISLQKPETWCQYCVYRLPPPVVTCFVSTLQQELSRRDKLQSTLKDNVSQDSMKRVDTILEQVNHHLPRYHTCRAYGTLLVNCWSKYWSIEEYYLYCILI